MKSMVLMGMLALTIGEACLGQTAGGEHANEPAPKFYKLDFVLKETEGSKVISTRAYSMEINALAHEGPSIRAGSKVPVVWLGNATSLDVGVSIDCRIVKEIDSGLWLTASADVSTVPQDGPANPPGMPVVRQNRWRSDVLVPLRKPTIIFSSDDLTSKRVMQLEVTATPLK